MIKLKEDTPSHSAVNDNCILCNRKADCFRQLTRKELQLFNKSKSTVTYRKGETIIKQGTQFTHVVSFNEGLAKLIVEVAPDKNVMIGLVRPSEILGGPGMFEDNKYAFSVIALTEAKICLIDASIFKRIIQTNNEFTDSFLSTFSTRYIQAINRLVSISQKQMYGRVAEAILYLSDSIYQADEFDMDLSRLELAEFTGMSKESVSRIFKEFKEDGTITSTGKRIVIKNKDRLRRIHNLC
ncbi:MAG: Crp/Fnr family transcriptional regulator [Bacteroidetes bacterium]|nr:Crp/Fnr family transcriptional regulator [Bacteroidota bacterium]